MSLVVSGIHLSVSAAYKALEKDLGGLRRALYGKLNGMELNVSQTLVRYSASNFKSVIAELKVNPTQLLAGYEVKIADGNHLSGTEHRLKVLRNNLAFSTALDALRLPRKINCGTRSTIDAGHRYFSESRWSCSRKNDATFYSRNSHRSTRWLFHHSPT